MIAAILYQAVTVPFYLAFETNDSLVTITLDLVCTSLYILDVFFTANTAFYKKGMLVTSRRAILIRYSRSWLVIDVFSSFPYSWLFEDPLSPSSSSNFRTPTLVKVVKISRLLRTIRLIRITKLRQYLSLLEQRVSNKISILLTVVYLCGVMTAVAHWAACGFSYMSQTTDGVNNWISALHLTDSATLDKYVTALYWAITTLTTTGYGDIVPISTNERIYAITIMILSAGIFSYLVGKIGSVIALIERDSSEQKDLLMEISRYLKSTEVPENLSHRALRYIEYKWETRKQRKELDSHILSQFSEPLKNEISETIFGVILTRVPMMSLFDRNFVSQIARSAGPAIFAQDDVIFEMGDESDALHYLEKGSVEMFDKGSKHTFKILQVPFTQKGRYFGEIGFYSGFQRTSSARCIKFTETLCVHRVHFLSLIRLSPQAHYTLRLINDCIQDRNFVNMGISCYLCGRDNHLAFECSFARIQIDKERLKQQWLSGRDRPVRKISEKGDFPPNFKRLKRKVKVIKRYSLKNVKSECGWAQFKHSSASFMRTFGRSRPSVMQSRDRKDFEGYEGHHRSSMPTLSLQPVLFEEKGGREESPPVHSQRRYSVIGGIRAYPLRDELYTQTDGISESSFSSSSSTSPH